MADLRLLILDEAHHTSGNHAYAQLCRDFLAPARRAAAAAAPSSARGGESAPCGGGAAEGAGSGAPRVLALTASPRLELAADLGCALATSVEEGERCAACWMPRLGIAARTSSRSCLPVVCSSREGGPPSCAQSTAGVHAQAPPFLSIKLALQRISLPLPVPPPTNANGREELESAAPTPDTESLRYPPAMMSGHAAITADAANLRARLVDQPGPAAIGLLSHAQR
jgi:hypothetical protein